MDKCKLYNCQLAFLSTVEGWHNFRYGDNYTKQTKVHIFALTHHIFYTSVSLPVLFLPHRILHNACDFLFIPSNCLSVISSVSASNEKLTEHSQRSTVRSNSNTCIQGSMVLTQKQLYGPMQKDRKPRHSPMHLWELYL